MPKRHHDEHRSGLMPAGRRWGFGAHSVVPYLNTSVQPKPTPGEGDSDSIRNPVFSQMERALEALRKRH
jgi:hypothetical protein